MAIVSCWTKPEKLIKYLESDTRWTALKDKVAAIGTLYGNGFSNLIRNLAYNVQLKHVIIFGNDRSGTAQALQDIYIKGVEQFTTAVGEQYRVFGTNILVAKDLYDNKIQQLVTRPIVYNLANDYMRGNKDRLFEFLNIAQPHKDKHERQQWEVEAPKRAVRFSANTSTIQVHANNPYSAYLKLIQSLYNFGQPVILPGKGQRFELQGLKVVIDNPDFNTDVIKGLEAINPEFNVDSLSRYYLDTFDNVKAGDVEYTYGQRMALNDEPLGIIKHFINKLNKNIESRKCFHSLWLPSDKDSSAQPCLTSVYVRYEAGKLNLFADFRSHNAMTAWPKNIYAMFKLLQNMCLSVKGAEMGKLIIHSKSITLSDEELEKAGIIANMVKYRFEPDPIGAYVISVIDNKIHVRLNYGEIIAAEFIGESAEKLQYEILERGLVTTTSHAMYIGRMLQKAELSIKQGVTFEQE